MQSKGFTIVELLIVIVVIAILAAITIVSYNGIQNRAYDATIQKDLRDIGARTAIFIERTGAVPSATDLAQDGVRVSPSSYGANYVTSGGDNYNMLRCVTSSQAFMYIAASKSGKVYKYLNGSVSEGVGPLSTHTTTCPANSGGFSTGSWIYSAGVWQGGLAG